MKAADEAGRFDRIGFDIISLRSYAKQKEGRPYTPPSQAFLHVTAELVSTG